MSDPRPSGAASSLLWLGAPWPDDLYPPRRALLFVLSGPSGVGKDSVIAALRAEGYPLHFTVTVTTRPRRPDEVAGVDYHFTTPAEFAAMRQAGELLETANVHGYDYGTPASQVRKALGSGCDVLLKIDVQGAAQVRARVPASILIFLGPPSMEELIARLARRGTEAGGYLERRIQSAYREMGVVADYDYVVVNREGRLAEAVTQVKAIVEAERLRVRPRECDLG